MSINEIIAAYIEAKQAEKAAAARVKELSPYILEAAAGRELFDTDDYTILIKTTAAVRLDTKSLYADFPDIKKTYGKLTESKSITAVEKATADLKTA